MPAGSAECTLTYILMEYELTIEMAEHLVCPLSLPLCNKYLTAATLT